MTLVNEIAMPWRQQAGVWGLYIDMRFVLCVVGFSAGTTQDY